MKKLYKVVFLGYLCLMSTIITASTNSGFYPKFDNAAKRNDDLPPPKFKNRFSSNLLSNTPTPTTAFPGHDVLASSFFKENKAVFATANFTSDAGANTCSNSQVNFTSQVTGNAPFTYTWNFGDGTPTSAIDNPSHSFVATGCGTQVFSVTLTIQDSTGATAIITKPITVKQAPIIDFRDLDNSFTPFDNCRNASASAPSYTVNVGNISSSPCISSYSISWGDGSPLQTNATFPATHTYTALGSYFMVVYGIGSNGCTATKTYIVKNVSNPSGGIISPGTTQNLCAPTAALQFAISGWGVNSPGTTYELDYGDGTIITLTQEQLMASPYYNAANPAASQNFPVPHSYTQTSCPGNSLRAVLTIRNSCDVTTGSIANITILKKPIANFNAPAISCANTNILFQNTTNGGYNQNCTQELLFTWDFGDGSPIVSTPLQLPQNITHNYAAPGTYQVTLTAIGFCGQDAIIKTICIEEPIAPQVTFNNVAGCTPVNVTTNNTTNLVGLCSTPTYAWTVNYAAGNCGSGTPVWAYTNGTNASSPSPSFRFTTPGTYTVSLIMSNSCGPGQNLTRTIVVKQPPRATINAIADSCGPVTIAPRATINSCAPASSTLSYAWSFPGGTPASSTTANPGSVSYTTAGTYTVSLVVTNECGSSTTATRTFTVKNVPALTTTPLSQVICSGSQTSLVNLTGNFSGVTFSWTATASAGVTGFQASGNGNTIPVQTIRTTGTVAGTVTYAITTSLNGCSSPPVNYVVTVNPAPFFTTQPSGFDSCQNATASPLEFVLNTTAGAPTYQWYSNTINATTGGTLIPGANNTTYTPSTATVGTFYYYAIVTFTSGDCPNLTTNIVRVRVFAIPTMTQQPTPSQNLCVGGAIPSALTVGYSGGFGTATYQWYSNTTNSNSGGILISGANSNSYLPPVFTTVGTYYYYATITLTGSGCGNLISDVAAINVVPDPVVDVQPLVSQSLCQNAVPTILSVTVSGGVGTYSYQWYRNTTNINTGGTLIAGATNSTYTPPTNTIGTRYYYVVITQTGAGCRVVSNTAQVIINTAPTLTTQPQGSTVCQNGNPTQLTVGFSNGVGTPSYQWYSNTANTTVGATAIPGANNSTFDPPSSIAGTFYYFVIVSFPSGGCADLTSNIARVIIAPQTAITVQPIPTQTFCVGGSVAAPLSVSYTGGTGTASYQWYSNTTNSTTGGNAIAGATNSTYTPPAFTISGSYYYYATVSLSGNGCDPAVSAVAEIIVVNDPVVDVQPLVTQTVCQNAVPANLSVTVSGGVGAYSYQWYSNTTNNNTGGTLIASATNSTFTPPTTTVGTRYYYVIITQTGAGCRVVSNTAEVQVNTGPVITSQPVGSTVCVGGNPAQLSVSYSNGAGIPSYQWYSNTSNSTVGATPISGANNNTFTPPSVTAGTLYYFVTITFPTGGCSVLTSNSATVIVEPQTSISVQPIPSQTFCVGGSVAAPLSVSYTGGTGSATYQWYSNTANSTAGGILITGATNSTYTPPVFNTAGSYYYYVTVSLSGNGCDPAVSSVAAIIVVSDPVVDVQPMPTQTVCQNAVPTDLSVTVSGGVGTYSYQWYSNTTNNTTTGTLITGATNSSYTPPTNNTGTLYYYAVIAQTGSGCGAASSTAQVIINLAPTMTTQPVGSTVCVGGTPTLLTAGFANGVGTPMYQWFVNTTNSTVGATQVSGATASTFAPPSSISGTFYYFATITFPTGGCGNLTSDIAEVVIEPETTISVQPIPSQTFCVGGSVVAPLSVSYIGGTGSATYQWYSNTANSTTGGILITGATNSTYMPPAFVTAGSYYYYATVSLSGNGCDPAVSDPAAIIVVSDPVVDVQPMPTQTVCQNAVPTDLSVTVSGGVGTYSYQWYSNTANNTTTGTLIAGATNSNYTPLTNTIGTLYYYAIISQTGAGCGATSITAQVIINLAPTMTTQPVGSTVCVGGNPTLLTAGFANGVGTPTYQWFVNTTNSTVGATLISGATGSTFAPPSSTAGTFYYFAVITFPTGGCGNLTSDIAEVIIHPALAVNTQPMPTQTFCVGGNVSAPLSVAFTGGTGTATYQWYSNTTNSTTGGTLISGATNSTYMPSVFNTAGTYYYYVTISLSGNGCNLVVSDTATIIVVSDPVLVLQPASQTLCQNAIPADLSVTATGGVGTYSYQWYSNTSNNNASGIPVSGATNSTFTPPTSSLGTIYYYVIVNQTGAGCSTTSTTVQVTVNSIPVLTTQPQSSTVCQGGTPTLLSVGFVNGVGIPLYQWFSNTTNSTTGATPITGASNNAFAPPSATAGTVYYFATITFPSNTGCSNLTSDIATVIIAPEAVISVQPIPVQTFCVGGSVTTPLTVSFTAGTGTASYQWYSNTTNSSTGGTAITGATNSNYMPPVFTAAGTYYYYVTVSLSGNGCDPAVSNTAEIIVVNDPIVTSQPLVSQNLCEGMAPTALSVTVSGGVGTYSYQWYSNTVDNTVSGTAITGAINSTFTSPTNSIGTVYYYCVITQTGSGCGTVSNTARVIVNPVPVMTANPLSSAVCQDQAANVLFVSYANGAGIPSYQWFVNTTNSNTGGNPISGAINSSYTPPTNAAGTFYYYAVISFTSASCANLASAVATVQVNPKPVISNKTRLICSGSTFTVLPDNSSGDLVPTGTLYTWTNPIVSPAGSVTGGFAQIVPQAFLSQTLTNNTTAPGTVIYTVTPVSGGCIGTAFTVTVTVNQAINPNVTITHSTCFGGNTGAIQTNITGGVPFTTGAPYQISWTGPNGFTSAAATISNLAPGNYTLSVTESGGCPFIQSYTVLEPLDFTIATDNEKDVSCFGIANGEISITVTGGTAPYRFSWTKDNVPFSNSEDISNLSPGSYTVSVFDTNNCGPKTRTFTITEPTLLEVNLINQTNILCFGTSTGAINVGVLGGTPNYTFAWTGPNAFRSTNQNLANVPVGTYNLVVIDNLGCTKPFSVTLTQAPELLVTYVTMQISCYNANNGSISISIAGGTGPYQILWSNASTNATIQNLAPGAYRATVTDANNCSKNIMVTISQPPIFTVNPVKTDVSCFGSTNGTINLNFVGGVAPVTVVWDDNATAGSVRTDLAPGVYNVLITDAQGCQISRSFTILEPQQLTVTGSTTDALACGAVNSGSISLVVIGGTAPYRYSWSNGSTTQNLTNIPPGNYSVTVTDARGCIQGRMFSVIRPQVLNINVITDTFADCDAQLVKQRFEARISGGLPPYTLVWSSGTVSGANNQFMETSQNGTVILRVTDSAGCTDQYSFNVDVPQFESPEFDVESEQFTVYGAFSIQDPILFTSNSTGNYTSITWNFGDGAVSTEENPIHTYTRPGTYVVTQTIVYPFGCTIVHKMTLEITKGYRLIPPTGFTPNGDGINDHFAPLFSGLENVELSIYDTWGAMIYSEKGSSLKGWDGNLKNKPAENGNYYFKVTGTTFYGTTVTENGPFTLIK